RCPASRRPATTAGRATAPVTGRGPPRERAHGGRPAGGLPARPGGGRGGPGGLPALRTGAGPAVRPVPAGLRHGGRRGRLVRPVDAPPGGAGPPRGDRRTGTPDGPAERRTRPAERAGGARGG